MKLVLLNLEESALFTVATDSAGEFGLTRHDIVLTDEATRTQDRQFVTPGQVLDLRQFTRQNVLFLPAVLEPKYF
jgi:hypothetical protein